MALGEKSLGSGGVLVNWAELRQERDWGTCCRRGQRTCPRWLLGVWVSVTQGCCWACSCLTGDPGFFPVIWISSHKGE